MKATPLVLFTVLLLTMSQFALAQCYPDRHSMTTDAVWISCMPSPNPNISRPTSHWVQYDLGKQYKLGAFHIWNLNQYDKSQMGFNEVAIDYSIDGVIWDTYGTISIPQAVESSTYEGFAGPDLSGLNAQYVLLTALNNHGGTCYGLGEIRIETKGALSNIDDQLIADTVVEVFPNPFQDELSWNIQLEDQGMIDFNIVDALGSIVDSGQFDANSTYKISTAAWVSGSYFLQIIVKGQVISKPITRIGND